jgi:hypothetical protein
LKFWFLAVELAASFWLGTWRNQGTRLLSWSAVDWRLLSQHRLHAQQK